MSRGFRGAVIGCAAIALISTGVVGAARADDTTPAASGATITALPAKALLYANKTPAEFVKVQLTVPTGVTCPTGMAAKVVGQRTAVTVAAVPDCSSVPGSAVWTVTANAVDRKREAVVKFITNLGDHSRDVGTLNVKILLTAPTVPVPKPAPTVYTAGAVVVAFPAKTVLKGGATPESVTVTLAVPVGLTCPADLTTKVRGQRSAVTVSAPDCSTPGFATWTVTASSQARKRQAVVKFVTINPTDKSRTVSTLNVKVVGPAKGHPSS